MARHHTHKPRLIEREFEQIIVEKQNSTRYLLNEARIDWEDDKYIIYHNLGVIIIPGDDIKHIQCKDNK